MSSGRAFEVACTPSRLMFRQRRAAAVKLPQHDHTLYQHGAHSMLEREIRKIAYKNRLHLSQARLQGCVRAVLSYVRQRCQPNPAAAVLLQHNHKRHCEIEYPQMSIWIRKAQSKSCSL